VNKAGGYFEYYVIDFMVMRFQTWFPNSF